MPPSDLESRLKSLPRTQPSVRFGQVETLAEVFNDSTKSYTLWERFNQMPWQIKSIGSLGIAASAFAVYLALSSSVISSTAFAQVVETIKDAKTLSFDTVIHASDGAEISRGRTYLKVPGQTRMETIRDSEVVEIGVMDGVKGKILVLETKSKTARLSKLTPLEGFDMAGEEIKSILSISEHDTESIGSKQIDERQVKGTKGPCNRGTVIVWTDATSGELVQIQFDQPASPPRPATTQIWSNIKVDPSLDPLLFSVTPPRGYKVMPYVELDLSISPAPQLAETLRLWVKLEGPGYPNDLEKELRVFRKKHDPRTTGKQPSEELIQLGINASGVLAFMQAAESYRGKSWQYDPSVTADQGDKILFWFRQRTGDRKYIAVFGDLRVAEVARDRIPVIDRSKPYGPRHALANRLDRGEMQSRLELRGTNAEHKTWHSRSDLYGTTLSR